MRKRFVVTLLIVVVLVALAPTLAFGQSTPKPTYTRGKLLLGPVALDALKSEFTDLGIVLKEGMPYYIRGTGVVSLWGGQEGGCDSVYRYNTPMEANGGEVVMWGQLEFQNPDTHLSDAMREQYGQDPTYNPAHEYEGVVIGVGKSLKARVFDGGDYGTNSGSLYVSVYEASGGPAGPKPGPTVTPGVASDSCTENVFYYGTLLGFAGPAIEHDVDRNWAAARIEEAKGPAGAVGLPTEALDGLASQARTNMPKAFIMNALNNFGADVGRQADRLCECPVFGMGTAFGAAESAAGAGLAGDRVILPALQIVRGSMGACGLSSERVASFEDRLRLGEASLAVYPDIAAERVRVQGQLDSKCRCAFPNWAGRWDTTYGTVILQVDGSTVTGTYDWKGGQIEGAISDDGRTLTGSWSQGPTYEPPQDAGSFIFMLDEDGLQWQGAWGYGDDSTGGGAWSGDRGT